MNTTQIIKMCNNIYANYKGMGRNPKVEDNTILNAIMHLYNVKQIKRKVRYSRSDGLYIIYQNKRYFEYEFSV